VELTQAGTDLLSEARRLLAQAERLSSVARRAQLGELGELRIGFTPSSAFSSLFPQTILEFRRRFRDVHLSLQEMTTGQQLTAMIERRLDIGFIRSPKKPVTAPSLKVLHLFEDPLAVFSKISILREKKSKLCAKLPSENADSRGPVA
jgi:DNA-binding transcriptional LysR family regulator